MKKLIAGILTALMSLLTLASPVLAADLGDYPEFLAVDGALDAYIVVGSAAAPSDVVGAIDLAIRLAELSYEIETIPGVEAITIVGKETDDGLFGTKLNQYIAATLTRTQVPTLFRGTIKYGGEDYIVAEVVGVPNATIENDMTKFNGTAYLDLSAVYGNYYYDFIFKEALNTTATLGYANPLKITLLGTEFSIVDIPTANSFKALTGEVGAVTETMGITYGDYTIYSDLAANNDWARIIVKDAADNTVGSTVIMEGGEEDFTDLGLTVIVLDVIALQDNTPVQVKIVVGPLGAVIEEYRDGDDFPGAPEDLWQFDIELTGLKDIAKDDYIRIKYNIPAGQEEANYIKLGEKIAVPGDLFELGFAKLAVSDFAKVTVAPDDAVDVYYDVTDVDAMWTNEPALALTADFPVFKTEESTKAYLIVKDDDLENVSLAYYDEAGEKIVHDSFHNLTAAAASFSAVFEGTTVSFDYQTTLVITVSGETVTANYTYVAADDKFTLGAENDAEKSDVDLSWETITGGEGEWDYYAISTYGLEVESIEANAGTDTVVFKIPAEQQKAHIYVGSKTVVTAEELTYKKLLPIKSAVARLDTEVGDAEKAKHLVSVGGPAVNRISAEALGVPYPSYGAASGIPEGAALIKVVEDLYTTGKLVVVVAGWEAANTRVATSILQNYDAYAADLVGEAVKITGETLATAVISAL